MSELDLKKKLAEHYKMLANRASSEERRDYYDKAFKKAAKAYNKAVMRGRR